MSGVEKESRKSDKKLKKRLNAAVSAPEELCATDEVNTETDAGSNDNIAEPDTETAAVELAQTNAGVVVTPIQAPAPLSTKTANSIGTVNTTNIVNTTNTTKITNTTRAASSTNTLNTTNTSTADDETRDVKRTKYQDCENTKSKDGDKPPLVPVGVKPKGHTVAEIHDIVYNSAQTAISKVDVQDRAHSNLLVMITNNVRWLPKNSDRDTVVTQTPMNYVVLRVLDSVGFNAAPYENFEGANLKHLVYCDKKSGKMTTKSVKLANIEKADNVTRLDCKSWEPHPTAMMKTKWCGLATGIVGSLSLGLPMVGYIFHNQKEAIMGPDPDIFDKMGVFTVAIIGVSARPVEQSKAGFGLKISSVKVLESVNITSNSALMLMLASFYNDKTDIFSQTKHHMHVKSSVEVYEHDLDFVSNLVRSSPDKAKVSEKPLVCINLKNLASCWDRHKVHIQANNKVLELEFYNEDGATSSIYHGKRFRISIPESMFTIQATGLPWIQMYFQWLLTANVCQILIVHDQWQMDKMNEGGASVNMHCCSVPDEGFMTRATHCELPLSPKLLTVLKTPSDASHLPLDLADELSNYTAWVVKAQEGTTTKTCAIILDISQVYTIIATPAAADSAAVDTDIDADRAMTDVPSDDSEDGSTNIPVCHKSTKTQAHTSLICRVYAGMDVERTVSNAFLLVLDTITGKVDSLLPVGIKAKPTYTYADSTGMAASGNILSNPKALFQ